MMRRRQVVLGMAAAVAGAAAFAGWRAARRASGVADLLPEGEPEVVRRAGNMPCRRFGRTGMVVSEVGFGSWPMGGHSYGPADPDEALRALAAAEELGCNFIDTAEVYGDAERLIGRFLNGRRQKWFISTKFSGQKEGLRPTLERQLRTLGTDAVDVYHLHWAPLRSEEHLYEELRKVKEAGLTRFAGVSVRSPHNIDDVLARPFIDCVELPLNLVTPVPFLTRMRALHRAGIAVISRSPLREGFLVGNFRRDTRFTDPRDQRSRWSTQQIAELVDQVDQFRFLEAEAGSMLAAAARYPLSYPEVSTMVIGTRSEAHARIDFGDLPGGRLSTDSLRRIAELQLQLGLWSRRERLLRLVHGITG